MAVAPHYEENGKSGVFQRLELMEALNMSGPEGLNMSMTRWIAQETLQKYTSLAADFELKEIKDRLEDLSFHFLYPEERLGIITRLNDLFDLREVDTLGHILDSLAQSLDSHGLIHFQIKGRLKSPFSIWQKMKLKNLQRLEDVRDLLGFRIIVDSIEECYFALEILHTLFPLVGFGFKDYILKPKDLVYQSLHTTIIGPRGKQMEIQIRTRGMDAIINSIYKEYWKQKTRFIS